MKMQANGSIIWKKWMDRQGVIRKYTHEDRGWKVEATD